MHSFAHPPKKRPHHTGHLPLSPPPGEGGHKSACAPRAGFAHWQPGAQHKEPLVPSGDPVRVSRPSATSPRPRASGTPREARSRGITISHRQNKKCALFYGPQIPARQTSISPPIRTGGISASFTYPILGVDVGIASFLCPILGYISGSCTVCTDRCCVVRSG